MCNWSCFIFCDLIIFIFFFSQILIYIPQVWYLPVFRLLIQKPIVSKVNLIMPQFLIISTKINIFSVDIILQYILVQDLHFFYNIKSNIICKNVINNYISSTPYFLCHDIVYWFIIILNCFIFFSIFLSRVKFWIYSRTSICLIELLTRFLFRWFLFLEHTGLPCFWRILDSLMTTCCVGI